MGFLDGKEFRVHLDCYPCFLKQTVIALTLAGSDEGMQERVLRAALKEIELAFESKTPAHATTFMHGRIREVLGKDPFKEIKSRYNQIALSLYPRMKDIIDKSKDPLWTASRLAIAGNVIDFGIFSSIDIEGTVKRALDGPLAVDEYDSFKSEIERANGVLYLLDNAGEIVFDRLLIETLASMGIRVTAVVKGGPIINDCTMEDSAQSGLDGICAVMDNGSDAVGTILESVSPEFRDAYERAPLVISKGQGNFETLLGEKEKRIFFLFQSKCGVVSSLLDLPEGSMLLVGN